MGSFNLDYFIHAANILLLAAYSVRDILWLRVFAVASSLAAIPYFLLQPTPLWAPFGWSVLFTGINIIQASSRRTPSCQAVLTRRGPIRDVALRRPRRASLTPLPRARWTNP
jgi:hypothetical protein